MFWLEHPERPLRFEFVDRSLDLRTGIVSLEWRLSDGRESLALVERFEFPEIVAPAPQRREAIEAALDLLHWVAGISYWKMACRGRVACAGHRPDSFQARALNSIYRSGLAEMAWRNKLRDRYWPDFPVRTDTPAGIPEGAVHLGLRRRVLVPMGGGKDSLVALERVRRAGYQPETVQVGSAGLIGRVAERAGTRHRRIFRSLAPQLAELNSNGALNGHVPITAINSCALVLAALLWDFDTVVFANERSADTPTLAAPDGRPVNHQFAKSLEFECLLDDWIRRSIATDLNVFSILRRDRELSVCREFAGLEQYHDVFSSCNRNFHLDGPRTRRWCLRCPKCLFVFLALAPFLPVASLQRIFGADLLQREELIEPFAELLELDGHRPFECVGEAGEARAAVRLLAGDPRWNNHTVVRELDRRLAVVEQDDPANWLEPGGPHRIPPGFPP